MIDDILSRNARTVVGIAIQARAVTLAAADLWEGECDEAKHERAFIEAVCAFAGVTPVPLEKLSASA